MLFKRLHVNRRELLIELSVLIFISLGISLISDLEYSTYEQHDPARFADNMGYRLVCGIFNFLLYGSFYWLFLRPYVFRRNLAAVVLCLAGFVFVHRLAERYILDPVIVYAPFVEAGIRSRTLAEMNSPGLYFTFNYLIISVFFPLLGLALLIRTLRQGEQIQVLKEQQLVSELNYLKAQLQPHFFFNTINNIYALALQGSADTAPMVAGLGELMRYILYEASQPAVLLQNEVRFLNSYIGVERIRHKAGKEIVFDVQGVGAGQRIEPLLLLPFVENAFKHGLEEETGTGFVKIVICQTEKELLLEVTNSKPGKNDSAVEKGIGLNNVRKRLDMLYPGRYSLEVRDTPAVYWMNLTLKTA